jgi:hypothetical protein
MTPMAYSSIVSKSLAFAVFAAVLAIPTLALAEDPPDLPAEPAPAADVMVVVPVSDPVIAPVDVTAASAPVAPTGEVAPIDDYYAGDSGSYIPEPYTPEPERRTTLKLSSGYIGLGIAPGMTLHARGFHPMTRLEMEFGGTLEHSHRDLALSFGVALQMQPYYGRKAISGGADVTSTLLLGPVYLRTGLGAIGGLPTGHLLHRTLPAVGGVVGVGLSLGREPMIRVGVDYDLRINTRLQPIHTLMLAFRFACCRKT